MDKLIDEVNNLLISLGHKELPLSKYKYYKKTDEEILQEIEEKNVKALSSPKEGVKQTVAVKLLTKIMCFSASICWRWRTRSQNGSKKLLQVVG